MTGPDAAGDVLVRGLVERWEATLPGRPDLGEELLRRWSEPHRHYHDRRHLAEVLDAIDRLLDGDPADDSRDGRSIRLAGWFHDAVHTGRARVDEEASAALARDRLDGVLPDAEVAQIVRLVLLTIDHRVADGDRSGAVLCDADLAILASTPQRYRRYTADVRAEYAHVAEPDFAVGRSRVLQGLADGPLYRTATGRTWEARARANLTDELSELRSRQPPDPGGVDPPATR